MNSTLRTTSSTSTTSTPKSRTARNPNDPNHNFLGGVDDSFGYAAEKYNISPGPIYDLEGSVPAVYAHSYQPVIGTEDRLKHFVVLTPGKGPALLPKRDSSTFQPRSFRATIGRATQPAWAVSRTWRVEGPVGDMPDLCVKSTSPRAPTWQIGKDSREKRMRKTSISKGPTAYQNDKQWTKPTSSKGSFGKSERNAALWIFGK